ncbi:MAG: LUD domain-containing protein, partial [Acidobacteria bacterium]|nr:LUD domain-containing protein [Acidobacteriota bacterium]
VRHNTQTFNSSRYGAISAIPNYEELKNKTRAIKEAALARLPELLQETERSVRRNGGHFFLARTADDASRYITGVCRQRDVRLVVKGKSMTSEEIHLNRHLEAAGIEVAETDLAEFILQLADEQPSHIIGPALHYSRERITALFKRKFHTDLPLDTGEELTRFAREMLRAKFLSADAGISGANFVTADTGSIVLVESEGNIRLTAHAPALHIAVAGVEKVLPHRSDLGAFVELLASSATGQGLASYTSVLTPPLKSAPLSGGPKREFHLVLLDNGRMQMREDSVLHEALYCIRCSACLNSCANFQTVGGHAFGGETYSGGIGGSWEAGTRDLLHARFSELCTGCSRCINQCPVRIDVPWLNSNLRQRINERDASRAARGFQSLVGAQAGEAAPIQKVFFGRYDIFGKWGARLAPVSNWMNGLPWSRLLLEKCAGVDRRRELPPFARPTLAVAARKLPRKTSPAHRGTVALFPDIFTNYGSPGRALASMRVLRALGIDVVLSEVVADGRASLSQGLIETAKQQALRTSEILLKQIRAGREIVVVEPSVLAMFRLDYRHFVEPKILDEIRSHCFEVIEFLWRVFEERRLGVEEYFSASRHPLLQRLFYHSHCQQKTIGAAPATENLLRAAGFDVVTSQVECCGMAGSFGYKKEFYELSMAVGEDLFAQVRAAEVDGPRTLVATGVSCQEQLHAGMNRKVYHPMELLEQVLALRS